jgi:hypothetical protein
MKKIILILLVLLPAFAYASNPVKAFGSICFGMQKKEVAAAIRSDRSAHVLTIAGWKFKPLANYSAYNNSGLTMLKLAAVPVPFTQYLTKSETENLLQSIKDTFLAAGYVIEAEHYYYPNPILLVKQGAALVLSNTEKQQYILISVPNKQSIQYTPDTFEVNIDILSMSAADNRIDKVKANIQQSAKDVDRLF